MKMLLTEYVVGRHRQEGGKDRILCLIVQSVLPTDCKAGRAELVPKLARQDLVLEFVDNNEPVEWLKFPDLPRDVIEAFQEGQSIPVVDVSDNSYVVAKIDQGLPPDAMAMRK